MVSFCVFVVSASAPSTKCHSRLLSFFSKLCSVPFGASLAIYGGVPLGNAHLILGSNAPLSIILNDGLSYCCNTAIFFGLSFALLTLVKISESNMPCEPDVLDIAAIEALDIRFGFCVTMISPLSSFSINYLSFFFVDFLLPNILSQFSSYFLGSGIGLGLLPLPLICNILYIKCTVINGIKILWFAKSFV